MLAGMGLANTLINCTTISITYGLSGVLETFVSQSFGSKQY
jgi:Na+-driven multidrug efflux pump